MDSKKQKTPALQEDDNLTYACSSCSASLAQLFHHLIVLIWQKLELCIPQPTE